MDFVLADLPYNVRKDRMDDHVQYDVFGSKDMKGMRKVLEKVMRLRASGHVFRSLLQFLLCKSVLAFDKNEKQRNTRERSGETEYESKEKESVVPPPTFGIENYALHCIRAFGSYQQPTAANRAAHTSVEEMTIHIRRSEASWRSFLITTTL